MNIKEIAEQAGMHYRELCDEFAAANTDGVPLEMMERFAELILEQERKEAAEHYLKLIRDCVATEREACAKVCDEHLLLGNKCAAAIRARGDKHD